MSDPHIVPTKYWHKLDDGRIQCDHCPRHCKLNEGQRGFCFVRMRQDNQVVLTSYGRSSGFAIDPVEKKPLFHFLPGSKVLSFGTAGCNLACKYCQNWHMSAARNNDILTQEAMPNQIAEWAKKEGVKSVAYTYNEPTIFMEYAVDTAKACQKYGIKSIFVTNGYICDEPRKECYKHMDAANVDLKGFTEKFYTKLTYSHLHPVLETLIYLKNETNVWFEITTLLIPGYNDDEKIIEAETKWILDNLGPDVPLHFTAFHPCWKMKNVAPTPLSTLQRSREIALKNGLHYVYTGNLPDVEGDSTYCASCGKRVIERKNYVISENHLSDEGKCEFCGEICAGIFKK